MKPSGRDSKTRNSNRYYGQNTQISGTRRQILNCKTLGIIILAGSEPALSIVYAPVVYYNISQSVGDERDIVILTIQYSPSSKTDSQTCNPHCNMVPLRQDLLWEVLINFPAPPSYQIRPSECSKYTFRRHCRTKSKAHTPFPKIPFCKYPTIHGPQTQVQHVCIDQSRIPKPELIEQVCGEDKDDRETNHPPALVS